jgi:hypothetical protein
MLDRASKHPDDFPSSANVSTAVPPTTATASSANVAATSDGAPAGEPEDCSICLEKVLERVSQCANAWCGWRVADRSHTRLQGELDCCAHMLCFACAKRWSESENTCPLCKQRFKSIVRIDTTHPAQLRRAEKIRVAQKNQSSRSNGNVPLALMQGPINAHLRMLAQMFRGSAALRFRDIGAFAVDVVDDEPLLPSPPQRPVAPSRPQIVDLTLLSDDDDDDDDDDSESSVLDMTGPAVSAPILTSQVVDLTAEEWGDSDDEATAPLLAAAAAPSASASIMTQSSMIVIDDDTSQ